MAAPTRTPARALAAAAAVALLAAPSQVQAQEVEEPRFTFEVFGGVATYGRFVEQFADEGLTEFRERELTAGTGAAFGGSLGFFPSIWGINDIAARLGFQWTTSEFEFENDDPRVPEAFAEDDAEAGDFNTFTVSLNAMKFLSNPSRRIAPYGIAGVSGTWWSLDDEEEVDPDDPIGAFGRVLPTLDGDDSVFRLGGMGGLGLQVRATDAFAIRLEAARFEIRNPFDGDGEEAFGISTGEKFDEPNRVGLNRFSLGLTYTLYK